MEMGASEDITRIEPRGSVFACPACGYTDGFHVSFHISEASSAGEIYLICPSCHHLFRLGFEIRLDGS